METFLDALGNHVVSDATERLERDDVVHAIMNAIAHYAAKVYGPNVKMPQGLGTGQLFTDNIPMPLEIRGDKLFVVK